LSPYKPSNIANFIRQTRTRIETVNTVTPRIFIAATEQDTGKTTTSLGLYSALRQKFPRIGYIKPVGQRFTDVDGRRIDEDSLLMKSVYETLVPIEDMSPITIEPDFTRRYINEANHDTLVRRIQRSFDRASWEKDFAIIEGSGHAGVGSVFDLSNATVARILASKVLLVVPGGIGLPIDEGALNKALFEREGVEVVGVVMNKVLAGKMEQTTDFARRGFARLGLELLGVMPVQKMLAEPSLLQIAETIRGTFHCNARFARNQASNVVMGSVSSANISRKLADGTLLIVPGDREDIVLAAISEVSSQSPKKLCGLILSDDFKPHPSLLEMLEKTKLPVVFSAMDSYTIAQRILSLTIKIQPGDTHKIESVQDLVARHIDIPRLLEKIGASA
jgi:BioD-like phosphotransacetylase family protein